MPTYTYQCKKCEKIDEIKQRITEDALTECPNCGSSDFERLIVGGTGFVLKGGGWYSDGYGASKSTGTDAAPKKEGSSGGSCCSGGGCGC